MIVYILRGIPGSGKSTYIKNNFPNAIICSADLVRTDDNGVYHYSSKNIKDVHWECFTQFYNHLKNGVAEIAIDNTNIKAWEISPYIALAKLFGYDYEVITVERNPNDCKNVHGVSQDIVNRFYNRFCKEELPYDWKKRVV